MDYYSTCRVSGVLDERGRRCWTFRRSGGFSQGEYKVAHITPPSPAFFLSLSPTTNNCPTVSITKSSRVPPASPIFPVCVLADRLNRFLASTVLYISPVIM